MHGLIVLDHHCNTIIGYKLCFRSSMPIVCRAMKLRNDRHTVESYAESSGVMPIHANSSPQRGIPILLQSPRLPKIILDSRLVASWDWQVHCLRRLFTIWVRIWFYSIMVLFDYGSIPFYSILFVCVWRSRKCLGRERSLRSLKNAGLLEFPNRRPKWSPIMIALWKSFLGLCCLLFLSNSAIFLK